MSLLGLLIVLMVLGVVGYLVTRVPMDGSIRTIIHVVIALVAVLFVLQAFGVADVLGVRVGRP